MANHRLPISIGDQFGDWTVTGEGTVKHEGHYWLCRCSCGAQRQVVGSRLARGVSTNCGHRRWGRSGALSDEEYFWSKVGAVDAGGCRPYLGGCDQDGYGVHSWKGKATRAHRLAWQLTHGRALAEALQMCHTCDNPPCCEPSHLFPGTTQDNTQDREDKRRGPQGIRNPRAKLRVDQVRTIRQVHDAGDITLAEIVRRYGIAHGTAWEIVHRKTWAGVEP